MPGAALLQRPLEKDARALPTPPDSTRPAGRRPRPPRIGVQALARPDEEAVAEAAKETAAALARVVEKKIGAENPKTLPAQPGAAQYIKYTPSAASAAHASGAGSRIIKMQDMAVDPLEPPKFRCGAGRGGARRGGRRGGAGRRLLLLCSASCLPLCLYSCSCVRASASCPRRYAWACRRRACASLCSALL